MKQVSGFSEDETDVGSYLADTDHTSLYMVRSSFTTSDAMIMTCTYKDAGKSYS